MDIKKGQIKSLLIKGNMLERSLECLKMLLSLIETFPLVNFGYYEEDVRNYIRDFNNNNGMNYAYHIN